MLRKTEVAFDVSSTAAHLTKRTSLDRKRIHKRNKSIPLALKEATPSMKSEATEMMMLEKTGVRPRSSTTRTILPKRCINESQIL